MEINGNNPLIGLKNSVRQLDGVQQSTQTDKSSGGRNSGTDKLELSIQSRNVQHIDDLIHSTADIREAKVEQISRELHAGTYNVKAEKIAEKIIGGTLLDEVF
jgi:flagellar biosynthesis anti-sigma factor FlgM